MIEIAIRYYAFEHPDEPWINVIPALRWNLNSAHTDPIINASLAVGSGVKQTSL